MYIRIVTHTYTHLPSQLGAVEYTDCTSAERVRHTNACPKYDTKQSDGEVSVMLGLWGMQSTPSLSSRPGSLWPGEVAPDRVLWCNGYRRRKWTRRHEFKSWTRLIAFHIALILLGKGWIQLSSLQLWVNSRTVWVLQPWLGN